MGAKIIKKCPVCSSHFEDYTKDKSMKYCLNTKCASVKIPTPLKPELIYEEDSSFKFCKKCQNEFVDHSKYNRARICSNCKTNQKEYRKEYKKEWQTNNKQRVRQYNVNYRGKKCTNNIEGSVLVC